MEKHMKERLKEAASNFFIIVTLIDVAIFILGSILRPNEQFGYEVMIYPVIYGAFSCIPGLIIRTKKELSIKQTLIREIFQLCFIIAIILVLIFGGRELTGELVIMAVSVTISVIVIYVLVTVIRWKLDTNAANQMTSDLERWKEKHTL